MQIEVKSGKYYKRHLALDKLLSDKSFKINKAYTLSNSNLEVKGNRIYLPIYMIMFINNIKIIKDQIVKLNIEALK